MDAKLYQQMALRTECNQLDAYSNYANGGILLTRINHAVMGLMGEVGEMASDLEKAIHYNTEDLNEANLKAEVGDALWYLALLADALGTSLDVLMKMNIEKLAKRYPEKFDEELSKEVNRNRQAEEEAMEDVELTPEAYEYATSIDDPDEPPPKPRTMHDPPKRLAVPMPEIPPRPSAHSVSYATVQAFEDTIARQEGREPRQVTVDPQEAREDHARVFGGEAGPNYVDPDSDQSCGGSGGCSSCEDDGALEPDTSSNPRRIDANAEAVAKHKSKIGERYKGVDVDGEEQEGIVFGVDPKPLGMREIEGGYLLVRSDEGSDHYIKADLATEA